MLLLLLLLLLLLSLLCIRLVLVSISVSVALFSHHRFDIANIPIPLAYSGFICSFARSHPLLQRVFQIQFLLHKPIKHFLCSCFSSSSSSSFRHCCSIDSGMCSVKKCKNSLSINGVSIKHTQTHTYSHARLQIANAFRQPIG